MQLQMSMRVCVWSRSVVSGGCWSGTGRVRGWHSTHRCCATHEKVGHSLTSSLLNTFTDSRQSLHSVDVRGTGPIADLYIGCVHPWLGWSNCLASVAGCIRLG